MARRVRIIGVALLSSFVLAIVAFLVWANATLQGERPASLAAFSDGAVSIDATNDGILMSPTGEASGAGLVFIPGAKVDPYAYLDKLRGVVGTGGTTVLILQPTLNLAILDPRGIDDVVGEINGVSSWYVGGHSLGGARACMLAADSLDSNGTRVDGLVLFGAYCANDISQSGLPVLSIGAENDGLSSRDDIADRADALPSDARFVEISGANHASFGDYGVQPGDGPVTAADAEVTAILTDELRAFLIER